MNRISRKNFSHLSKPTAIVALTLISLLWGCENEKTKQADLYVTFAYNGEKIDTTTNSNDQVIFRNVDGTPPVYVPAYSGSVCDDKIFIGTYPLHDTLEWHLRLVDPDGNPANLKLFFNKDREPVLINDTLHFILPGVYDFDISTAYCDKQAVLVIGN